MKKLFLISLLITFTLLSCKITDLSNPVDSNYPTVVKKLSATTLSELRSSFAQKNKYLTSSLNEYGFCSLLEGNVAVATPELLPMPSQSEAIEIVKTFVSQNSTSTGVKNAADLTFSEIFSGSPFWDGASSLVLKSANQRIDTVEVINSQIVFQLKSRELVTCQGNWYATVYIPSKFNINREYAKASLVSYVVWHSTIAGVPYSATITTSSLEASTTRLVIYPLTIGNQIELHVTWQINIPGPVYYILNVDVMTGEIVSKQPTIIS